MNIGFLKGKKTYLVALIMLLMALQASLAADGTVNVQSFLSNLDWQLVLNALGLGTLRAGVAKVGG